MVKYLFGTIQTVLSYEKSYGNKELERKRPLIDELALYLANNGFTINQPVKTHLWNSILHSESIAKHRLGTN
jgi:hypothetical protein